MLTTVKTPGVYVDEIPVFPPSVAEVETAIPAFVGYTAMADRDKPGDLLKKPVRISSYPQFQQYFGPPNQDVIVMSATAAGTGADTQYTVTDIKVNPPSGTGPADPPEGIRASYLLPYSVKMYFDNGGGDCYIVSAAKFDATNTDIDKAALVAALDTLRMEDEPTLLVVPEAVKLKTAADYKTVVDAMLLQCSDLKDRFAVIDAWHGQKRPTDPEGAKTLAEINRDSWTGELKYGAAYYPFVKTSMNYFIGEPGTESTVTVKVGTTTTALLKDLRGSNTALYNTAIRALREYYVDMPPSGAVVGAYAATDTKRGVWKAPANVALNDVIEPLVKIDDKQQENLNIDPNAGKSINVLRSFAGKGTLIWGARTLAGNDNEWRYVPVRRFFNMVEESVKKSTYWAVFEQNDANTWVKVRGMIENYLTQKWREGALAGATTKDAFFVRCGLGTTMTSQDILEGKLYVEIGMAVVRPAEFIVLRFYHKLQTS